MTSLKELIARGKTDRIFKSLTVLEMLENFGIPTFLGKFPERKVVVINIGYGENRFFFSREEKLIGCRLEFPNSNSDDVISDSNTFYDYAECSRMTRDQWFDFFHKEGIRPVEFCAINKAEEYYTGYCCESTTNRYLDYSITFSFCEDEDRIQWLSVIYKQ